MLNEEVAKYRELSGDNNPNTPICRIGGYLDGYERALAERKKGKKIVMSNDRMRFWACNQCEKPLHPNDNFCPNCGADMRGEKDE